MHDLELSAGSERMMQSCSQSVALVCISGVFKFWVMQGAEAPRKVFEHIVCILLRVTSRQNDATDGKANWNQGDVSACVS